MMRVTAIVLAAGRSSRMGGDKLLMAYAGEPLAARAVRLALRCGFDEVIVVASDAVAHALCAANVRFCDDPQVAYDRNMPGRAQEAPHPPTAPHDGDCGEGASPHTHRAPPRRDEGARGFRPLAGSGDRGQISYHRHDYARFGGPDRLPLWRQTPDRCAGRNPRPASCRACAHRYSVPDRPAGRNPRLLRNPDPDLGQSHSVRLGVAAARGDILLFLPADQPLLTVDTLRSVARAAERGIAFPTCDGRRGAPMAFPARYRDELLALTGDIGGRAVLRAHPEAAQPVPIADARELMDIDTPADYETLRFLASCDHIGVPTWEKEVRGDD